MSSANYDSYRQWKGWTDLFAIKEHERKIFVHEFSGVVLIGKTLLDIGFGAGGLLAWAQTQGAAVEGVELQPELRDAAAARGIPVHANLDAIADRHFDLIAMFDVLEHISATELPVFLSKVIRVCKNDAQVFVRVPNCQSPVGLLSQFGDPTHLTMLSGPIVAQLLSAAGFQIVEVREACDPDFPTGWVKSLLKPVQKMAQNLFKLVYRLTWSTGSTPLSMNVLVVARKS